MVDKISKEQRSHLMGRVRGKNTKPELIVRKRLHALGYRFRVFDRKLPCHPDIVLTKYKTAIFIHGCFWHGHQNCKYFRWPKSNIEFWKHKIKTNRKRDSACMEKLNKLGWKAIVIWECELKPDKVNNTILRIDNALKQSKTS